MLSKNRLSVCQCYKVIDGKPMLNCRRTYESIEALYDVDTLETGVKIYQKNGRIIERNTASKYFDFIESNIPAVVYDATKWQEYTDKYNHLMN